MGIPISALPPVPATALTDIFPEVQGSTTYKATLQQLLTLYQTSATNFTGLTGVLQAPTAVNDANGNRVLGFVGAGSAVNYLDVTNAPSGSYPTVSAQGADADIALIMAPKGDAPVVAISFLSSAPLVMVPNIIANGGKAVIFDIPTITANRALTIKDESGTIAYLSDIPVVPSLPVSLSDGGTGASLTAADGGIFYSTATAGAILSPTSTANQVLLSGNNSAPSWSTAVYPVTTTINQLLYSSSNDVIQGLSTANNGVLITSAGGVPSISSTLPTAVQSNITSLGTVTSGTWNGSSIPLANGGTNANLTASNGGIFYSTATAGAILAGTATASRVLLSGSAASPSWSTATYPSTTTANQILYSSSSNVIDGLVTANNGILITSGAGVPSISSTLPSAVQSNITSVGTITSGTWNGSTIAVARGGTGQTTINGIKNSINNNYFSYIVNPGINNVTGNGAIYTVVFNQAVNLVGSGYDDTTGVFTAPFTGLYAFYTSVAMSGLVLLNNSSIINMSVGGVNWYVFVANPFSGINNGSDTRIVSGSALGALTAGQTVSVTVQVSGNIADNVDIDSGSAFACYFIG